MVEMENPRSCTIEPKATKHKVNAQTEAKHLELWEATMSHYHSTLGWPDTLNNFFFSRKRSWLVVQIYRYTQKKENSNLQVPSFPKTSKGYPQNFAGTPFGHLGTGISTNGPPRSSFWNKTSTTVDVLLSKIMRAVWKRGPEWGCFIE